MFVGRLFSRTENYHWSIGFCSSSQGYKKDDYDYKERCCLPPGDYLIRCSYSKYSKLDWHASSYGWVDIQGHKYCHKFLGYTTLEKVSILGMNLNFPKTLLLQ